MWCAKSLVEAMSEYYEITWWKQKQVYWAREGDGGWVTVWWLTGWNFHSLSIKDFVAEWKSKRRLIMHLLRDRRPRNRVQMPWENFETCWEGFKNLESVEMVLSELSNGLQTYTSSLSNKCELISNFHLQQLHGEKWFELPGKFDKGAMIVANIQNV